MDYEITLDGNDLNTRCLNFGPSPITILQQKQIESLVDAASYHRIFYGIDLAEESHFSMPAKFRYPFYGQPARTIVPDLFVDLPNFKEISRELLHGIHYREKEEGAFLRMSGDGEQQTFKDEPLKLFDGVPVFDPRIFSEMGTADIKKVDAIFSERLFGDLVFQGVIAVYSKNPNLSWVEHAPGLFQFNYAFLQPEKNWDYEKGSTSNEKLPDMRTVFLRKHLGIPDKENVIRFQTSDIKGTMEINVISIYRDNKVFVTSQKLEIK